MRALALLLLAAALAGADAQAAPPTMAELVAKPLPPQLTAEDLQNLIVCARRLLPTLSTAEMAVLVGAIARGEADLAQMRAPRPSPARSTTAAAVAGSKP